MRGEDRLLQHSKKTYLLIGHVASDVTSDGRIVVGGTVSYGGLAAKRFGWQPVVVTAAAADFQRPAYLDRVGAKIARIKPDRTTASIDIDCSHNTKNLALQHMLK